MFSRAIFQCLVGVHKVVCVNKVISQYRVGDHTVLYVNKATFQRARLFEGLYVLKTSSQYLVGVHKVVMFTRLFLSTVWVFIQCFVPTRLPFSAPGSLKSRLERSNQKPRTVM